MESPLRRSRLVFVAVALCSVGALHADDWPQWRGPDRTGLSGASGLLQSWPDGGPELLWTYRDAGVGYSSSAVVDGRLYTMGARGEAEFVMAVDVEEGQEAWATEIGPLLTNDWGNGPRATPTIDDGRVFVLGGGGGLVCLDAADGKLVWQRQMAEFGGTTPDWGYTESVLVDGDRVLCTPGGERGAVVALDRKTGKLLWQSQEFTDPAQYSSIIMAANHGVPQFIQRTMQSIVGIGADGRLLWHAEFPGRVAAIPTPVYREGRVFVTAGYGAGCKLIAIDADQNASAVYDNKVMKNHHGGVILVGDHIYGYSDGYGWTCQAFDSGELVWNEKEALGKGSVSYADGRLYCLAEDGNVALIEATPRGFAEHGRFELKPQSELRSKRGAIWAHPAIADGRLYLRDQELLMCYDVKAGSN